MRKAEFTIIVEDLEDGSDRINIQLVPLSGDQELMFDVARVLIAGGDDAELALEFDD